MSENTTESGLLPLPTSSLKVAISYSSSPINAFITPKDAPVPIVLILASANIDSTLVGGASVAKS